MTTSTRLAGPDMPRTFNTADLISPAPKGYSTPERLDPYWHRLWTSGSTVTWRSYETAETHVKAGLGGLPVAHRISAEQAWAVLEGKQSRNALLRFLAVLGAWRTLTCEQAEALSGSRGTSKVFSRLVAAAFRVGLVELGSPASGLIRESTSLRGTLYRPGNPKAFDRILNRLTFAERMSLAGGQKWDAGGQFDRHNILATELGIRIAEYCDVATVLGEKLSTIDLLAKSGLGLKALRGDQRSADLTIVRRDGLKVAIEITASTSKHFARKVRRWAEILNEQPMNESGLCVVFVIAPPHGATTNAVKTETYKAVAEVVRAFPGTATESIASRIGVATWSDWFPQGPHGSGGHHVREDFFSLTVEMAAGMRNNAMTWSSVPILDERIYSFEPKRPGLTAILDNAHLLWSAPIWLRDHRKAPSLIPTLFAQANVSQTIPYSKAVRHKDHSHQPGKAKGAVGDTKMPRRMLPYM